MQKFIKYLIIDDQSVMPKYKQLVYCLVLGIKKRAFMRGNQLPSIHDLCVAADLSKKSVEKAYNELKKAGLIVSVPGKGYFISSEFAVAPKKKVLLLINKLSWHKKVILDAFMQTLGDLAAVDLYIYNNDLPVFKRLLLEKHEGYDKVVIIPHFFIDEDCPVKLLEKVSADKLIIMDKLVKGFNGQFSAVYEDFKNDIFCAMETLLERLDHYVMLILIFPRLNHFAKDILEGFKNFCKEYSFNYKIVDSPDQCNIGFGQAYIFLQEEDMVEIIERIQRVGMVIGKDIGVISYYDTPLKRVILDGITTISADFGLMGRLGAECVLDDKVRHVAVPFAVNIRNSL